MHACRLLGALGSMYEPTLEVGQGKPYYEPPGTTETGEAEGEYLPWSRVETIKKGTGYYSDRVQMVMRAQILLDAVSQAPSTKKVIRLSFSEVRCAVFGIDCFIYL